MFVGIKFSAGEQEAYDAASIKEWKYRKRLIEQYGITDEPFGEFMREVQRMHADGVRDAGLYLNAFTQKRAALANAENKRHRLFDLVPAIRAADRTILFSQTQPAAEEAVATVAGGGIQGTALHSGMDMHSRSRVFAFFESGKDVFIAAPKLLDEGIDVPAADLAIILASSRSRRQMIQRMGRVLRKKDDGRLARVVIMYVEGTMEDPSEGGHETFLDLVRDAAAKEHDFRPHADAADIVRYLNQWNAADQQFVVAQPSEVPANGRKGLREAPQASYETAPIAPDAPLSSPEPTRRAAVERLSRPALTRPSTGWICATAEQIFAKVQSLLVQQHEYCVRAVIHWGPNQLKCLTAIGPIGGPSEGAMTDPQHAIFFGRDASFFGRDASLDDICTRIERWFDEHSDGMV